MAQANVLRVVIDGDAKDLDRTISKVNRSLGGLGRGAYAADRGVGGLVQRLGGSQRSALMANAAIEKQKQSLSGLATFAKRATLVTGGLAAAGISYGLKLNAQWETNEKSFGTLLGSLEKGKKLMEDLRQVSSKSYLRLTDFQEVSKGLIGVGVSAKRVVPLMKGVNAAIVAVGGDSEKLRRVTEALGQIKARGKVSARELQRLAQAGLPVNRILQKEFNLTSEQVANIGHESIDADRALKAISDNWSRKYGPGLAQSMKSGAAQMDLFKKNAEGFLRVATNGIYEQLAKKALPAANEELSKFTDILNNERLSGSQKIGRLEKRFGNLIDRVGELGDRAMPKVGAAIDRFAPMFGRLIEKVTPLVADMTARMISVMAPVVARGAGTLAGAFVKGFMNAPILGKLLMSGWLFTKLGGFAAIQASGVRVGATLVAGIRRSFAAGAGTFDLAQSFGRGTLASGTAAAGSMGWQLASSVMAGLKRAVPIVAGAYAITDVIGKTVSDGPKAGLERAGATAAGALAGGLLGSLAGPGGALIGAGIGSALGGPIEGAFRKLFGKNRQISQFARQVRWADEVLRNSGQVRMRIASRVDQAESQVTRANRRSRRAADRVKLAEQQLAEARRQYGPNSRQAASAEARLAAAKERSNRATRQANRLERLRGGIRQAAKQSFRQELANNKQAVSITKEEVRQAAKAYRAAKRRGASSQELTKKANNWLQAEKKLTGQQKAGRRLLEEIAQKLGPKVAAQMNKQAAAALKNVKRQQALKQTLAPLPDLYVEAGRSVATFGRTTERKLRPAKRVTAQFGDTAARKMRKAADAATESSPLVATSVSEIVGSYRDGKSSIQSGGAPQKKRRGGLVQRFRSGGQVAPVLMSPGETIHDGSGVSVVPGRPEARDSVLVAAPVDSTVLTFDGQRLMAGGASLAQARARQKPHFGAGAPPFPRFKDGGQIERPRIVGGTMDSRGVSNKAIGAVHSLATSKLKKLREQAAAAVIGKGVNGLLPRVKAALAFAKANGWGGSVTSGFRSYAEQAALYAAYLNGTGNLAAPPGSSNHEGGQAVDVSDTEGFARAMALMGPNKRLYRRIPGEPWHFSITGYRKGGRIQRLKGGGKVTPRSMRRKARNRTKAPWLKKYGRINKDQAYTLAVYAGIPNPTWASRVMYGESSGNPRTVGHDPGGTRGYGLWQITTGYNDHIIRRYGGTAAMFDPLTNARAARDVYLERRKMGVSGESGWYGRLGPAGKFDPGFFNEIMWAPGQREHAAKASRKRRKGAARFLGRVRNAKKHFGLRGLRKGGRPKMPRWVTKLARSAKANATRARYWAQRDPAKSLRFRRQSARQQKKAGKGFQAWRKSVRTWRRSKSTGSPAPTGGGGDGTSRPTGGGLNVLGASPLVAGLGAGQFGKLAKKLPPAVQRQLQSPWLNWQGKRDILDRAVTMAEATESPDDDVAAHSAIIALEERRRARAAGVFATTGKALAKFSPKGIASRRKQNKRLERKNRLEQRKLDRANRKDQRLLDKLGVGKKTKGKRKTIQTRIDRRTKLARDLERKRNQQIRKNQGRIGRYERLTERRSGALSDLGDAESAIRSAEGAIKDVGGSESGADLAEALKALTEETERMRLAMERGFDADSRTLRQLLTDALSGSLAGRADPPARLGFSPAVNF